MKNRELDIIMISLLQAKCRNYSKKNSLKILIGNYLPSKELFS